MSEQFRIENNNPSGEATQGCMPGLEADIAYVAEYLAKGGVIPEVRPQLPRDVVDCELSVRPHPQMAAV